MSRNFPQFLSLPSELQLMVFDQFLAVSLNPRIVLLDTEERQLFVWDHRLLGWCWRVSNREQLQRESPAGVAVTLLQVSNDAARYAANQFLDRIIRPFNPPQVSHGLMGLGLCFERDVFWLPDDLMEFLSTTVGPPVDLDQTDGERITSIMISLEPFEEALRWATQRGDESDAPQESLQFLSLILINILDSFPGACDLTIIVDIARGRHITWDEIEVVRGSNRDLWRLRVGGAGRCHSLYQTYESLNQDLVNDDPTRHWGGRALPELHFAFRRQARSPPRMTIE